MFIVLQKNLDRLSTQGDKITAMCASSAILVIDIGLTNCKSIVFSVEGEILEQSSISYPTSHPRVGFVEQDPEDWWNAVCETTRRISTTNPTLVQHIEGISVTGHMHTLVGVDNKGDPVTNALVLGDQRSIVSARLLTDEVGIEKIYRTTGTRMEESMPAAKIHWLKTNLPEIFSKVNLFTSCKDYIRSRLTGDRFSDPIDAGASSLYDLQNGCWSEELIRLVGTTVGHLPEICAPTTIAGKLKFEAASSLGLREGIPVVVGSGDDIEALGSGLISCGVAKEHIGTTGAMICCVDRLVYDEFMVLELCPYIEEGLYLIGGSITSAGASLAWAYKMLGLKNITNIFDSNIREYLSKEPIFFIPHLSGERCPSWNPNVRGGWLGLSINHTNTDLMLAVYEGVANALAGILDRIDALAGVQQALIVDKQLNDDEEWIQMRANIYGRSLGINNTPEPTGLGAMILGAVGIGFYPNTREATNKLACIERYVQPAEEWLEYYRHKSLIYKKIQPVINPIWQIINNTKFPSRNFADSEIRNHTNNLLIENMTSK